MPTFLLFLVVFAAPLWAAQRTTLSLDGQWDIADSVDGESLPAAYSHKAPVPGLAHSAVPGFKNVDEFESRQLIQNRVERGLAPASALVSNAGVSRQERNWFWYRRRFDVPGVRSVATLRINKAQFGAAVWVNGQEAGQHLACFTAAIFDVSDKLRQGSNEIVVRVGAHPGVLPPSVSAGTDFEKNRWTPGIYDSVSLALSDNPAIETLQVAPSRDLQSITVQTRLRNQSTRAVAFALQQAVHGWKSDAVAARAPAMRIHLAAQEERTVTQQIAIPAAKLWTPEQPNLYLLETGTGGDAASTRFGMREFHFETATKRAYLNGRPYFMRGSNITLHRFFEDPKSGVLPWDEKWVRKLLVEIPKEMHWNAFRFCIGPVPDKWLDIADEAGLLIQNEYFVWTGKGWHGAENQVRFDAGQMIREYGEWMRDNWNHPSVAIWDANNETFDPVFDAKIIPAVRGLDLSNRPWENSYNPPAGPDDPVEDHPYEFHDMAKRDGPEFSMTTFEKSNGKAPGAPSGHALILNEYGWLWLNRDGSPTELTKDLYPRLLPKNATAQDRLALNAYLLGGITEFWRAYRQYAAVLHFVYLTSSDPLGYTADHFRDVEKLELEPHFRDYVSQAFAPLGVYLSFWQAKLAAGKHTFQVMLVNDEYHAAAGSVTVSLQSKSRGEVARAQAPFEVGSLGQTTIYIDLDVPNTAGDFLLQAKADAGRSQPTLSRRNVTITPAAEE
ncbi:putative Glycosyl hydrolase family 2 [Candidatus Sulfopaludibacter sp. SbA6]|nr:putative Glycosyl hydrolase family 2 [Candidatus Sulfopaludibacter sp. SbA6]